MPDAEGLKQVVPAAELRYFDGGHFVLDEFADAIAEVIIDVLPLGPAHHDKVPRCANSCEGIDPYHRPIDSSRWFWLNRICIRKNREPPCNWASQENER
jgi:hypothetical protein